MIAPIATVWFSLDIVKWPQNENISGVSGLGNRVSD